MKKVITQLLVLSVMLFVGQGLKAQTNVEFRDQINQFLKEEGFQPTYDPEDESLNFKYEGNRFYLMVENNGPYYIELHEVGFTSEGTNRAYLLAACNRANNTKRCGKAYISSGGSVNFTVEFYVSSLSAFREVFYTSLRLANAVKKTTKDFYNELDD